MAAALARTGLVLVALLTPLTQAVPSIYECTRHFCYNDLLHVTGGTPTKLLQACKSGALRPGQTIMTTSGSSVPRHQSCGWWSSNSEYSYYEMEFRPVCECVEKALVPRHCDSIPCFNELYQIAGQDVLTLHDKCATVPWMEQMDVEASLDLFRTRPTCGRIKGDESLVVSANEYRPVCNCLRALPLMETPETDRVVKRRRFESYIVDVYLHVVVLSKSSMRYQRFHQRGQLEGEFQHLVQRLTAIGIKFIIKSIDLTVDATWATGHHSSAMRRVLHQGDSRDLNFYMIDDLDGSDAEVAPVRKDKGVYCTPPPLSEDSIAESIHDPLVDGCVIRTDMRAHDVDAEMNRWIGACTLATGNCVLAAVQAVYNALATYRFVPLPRGAISPVSYIDAEKDRNFHCAHIDCYNEMLDVVSARHKEADLIEQCRSGIFSVNETVTVRDATQIRPLGDMCGQWRGSDYSLSWYKFRRPCDCLTANGTISRWSFAQDVIIDEKTYTIPIDVFMHFVAANASSAMAQKYRNLDAISDDFAKMTSFFRRANLGFRLKLADLTVNDAWARGDDSARMRQALYSGSRRDLNLYFIEAADLDRSLLNHHDAKSVPVFCTFPYSGWWALLSGLDPEHDGCMVANGARPGEIATAIQHWLGMQIAMPGDCSANDCGPAFTLDDVYMLEAVAVLNRGVQISNVESRMRLYEALDE